MDLGSEISVDSMKRMAETNGTFITGLGEDKIYLQIGPYFYVGDLDETVGETMLFEAKEHNADSSGLMPLLKSMRSNDENNDDGTVREPDFAATYKHKTTRIVQFERVEINMDVIDKIDKEKKLALIANESEHLNFTNLLDDDFSGVFIFTLLLLLYHFIVIIRGNCATQNCTHHHRPRRSLGL
ncbi:hypothetical protein BDF14DRAFT_1766996 [Spinellus fusiger]|nr:hypothetical protein BDF14DRAFT_1766996 [Spinellus fusiger]